MTTPTKRSCLETLTKKQLVRLDRTLEVGTPQTEKKAEFVGAISYAATLREILDALKVGELRDLCWKFSLPKLGSKKALVTRLALASDADSAMQATVTRHS